MPQWFYPTELILLGLATFLFILKAVTQFAKKRWGTKEDENQE